MINVTLVGTGNVSSHLQGVFMKTENVRLNEVISSRGNALKKTLSEEKKMDRHIYIIAVSDDVIPPISEQFNESKSLITHTSGSVSIHTLPKGVRRGVFYPLQTFSKEREVDFKSIPICIEAEKKEDLKLLNELASSISGSVYEISSEQRKSLHIAAVFVNNFTNHLFKIGDELCQENEVPFEIIKPLILETAKKIESLHPFDAQTGPARRNDQQTIKRHTQQLKNPMHKKIYEMLTKSIRNTYGEEL